MSDFQEYLDFIHRFNPSHTFSDEELEFLRNDFQDLKTFVEELGETDNKRTAMNFEEVLKDEIFYHQGNSYVKIDETEAREFPGTRMQMFGKLTEVEINQINF